MQFCLKLEQEKSIEDKPLNKHSISGLATLAFPTLFPDGKGDPTNPCLHRDLPFNERIKHLLKFADTINGKFYFRFASHPRFSYWAPEHDSKKTNNATNRCFL